MLNITAKTLHTLADEIFYFYLENGWEGGLFSAIEIGIIKPKVATLEDIKKWNECGYDELPFADANELEVGEEYYIVCSEKEIEQMLKEKKQ